MKKNQGFALAEFIVSLIIVGIIVTMIAQIFASNASIDRRSRQTENISDLIATELLLFSRDPQNYTSCDKYYNSTFDYTLDNSGYYLNIVKNVETDISRYTYTVTITVYVNNEVYVITGKDSFSRTIVVKI